jgi:hypothetical protein
VYVKGTSVWHRIRRFDGGISTVCGRILPIDAPTSDAAVPDVFSCWACRHSIELGHGGSEHADPDRRLA